jgi:hypothetical protein
MNFDYLEYTDEERIPPSYLVQGAKALGSHLKSWTQRKDVSAKMN